MLDISVLKYNEVIECKARILQLLSFIKVLLKRCQDKQSYKNYDVEHYIDIILWLLLSFFLFLGNYQLADGIRF